MQFFHRKRYRFFYPAGLISLVLLPVLGLLYLKSKEVFVEKYVVELNVANPQDIKRNPEYFPDPVRMRKYQAFRLDSNKIENANKLLQFQLAIRKMLSQKDTINGVKIIFDRKANYDSFIQSINICEKENARSYTPLDSSFYVLYVDPKSIKSEKYIPPGCGTPEAQAYSDRLYQEANEWKHKENQFIPGFTFLNSNKPFWPAGILYLIMVALTAQKVVRQIRRPNLNH